MEELNIKFKINQYQLQIISITNHLIITKTILRFLSLIARISSCQQQKKSLRFKFVHFDLNIFTLTSKLSYQKIILLFSFRSLFFYIHLTKRLHIPCQKNGRIEKWI
jgi:hypothetical protein